MPRLPLVEGVLEYTKEGYMPLCMPGHKGGIGFLETDVGRELYDNIVKCDITEVEGVDNLHFPQGIIKEAQQLLSSYYKSKKSYFLINGSTSGNLAMIFTCFNEGDKIFVERNCHKSILNGLILRKLRPIYIKNKINDKFDAPMSVDMEHLLHNLEINKDAKGIIVTYPNYYGVCSNLKRIVEECKKRNMKVLVDSAHGAHFGVAKGLPESAVSLGADMVVMSAHKTLPSLNQASYLHVNNEELISKTNFYVDAFLSTSPSYMIMCSMDYSRYYLEEKGRQAYENLLEICLKYRTKINQLPHFHVLDETDEESIDLTRYTINVEKGYSAEKVYNYLRSNKIQPEMCDGRNIILIFSSFNCEEDFKAVYLTVKNCPIEEMKEDSFKILIEDIPYKAFEPYEIIEKNKECVFIDDSLGRICAEAVVPYPPGVPIMQPGEIVGENQLGAIKYYIKNGSTLLGINNMKIMVVGDNNE